MSDSELEKWPDCPKWARASEAPGWLMIVIYGGGMIWVIVGLLFQGRIHELFDSKRILGAAFAFGWGTLFTLIGIWLIVTCRRARRIMAEISARNRSEK